MVSATSAGTFPLRKPLVLRFFASLCRVFLYDCVAVSAGMVRMSTVFAEIRGFSELFSAVFTEVATVFLVFFGAVVSVIGGHYSASSCNLGGSFLTLVDEIVTKLEYNTPLLVCGC